MLSETHHGEWLAEWVWLPLREALPDAAQRSAFGGSRIGEECSSQDVVVGAAGGLQYAIAFVGEHGEPLAAVGGVDLAANETVSFESGHEMGRTGRAE